MSTKTNRIIVSIIILIFIGIVYINITPSTDKAWNPRWKFISQIEPTASGYEFSHIRNWSYQNQQIRSQEYDQAIYNPANLTQVWFIVEPFGKWNGIAHTYLTFDFDNMPPLSFSIAARLETGESYSPIKGLFKQYELAYVWGYETDLLVRRAVYLDHQVYMYPLDIPESWQKQLFITLVEETERLHQQPRFYNTLTTNCTNTLAQIVNQLRPGTLPWNPARLLTGYADEYLYNLGYLPNETSFSKVQQKYAVDQWIRKHYQDENFSTSLRIKLKQ